MSVFTFQVPCGCIAAMEDGISEPCLVHEHEGVSPMEALGVHLRVVLLEEHPRVALTTIRETEEENK